MPSKTTKPANKFVSYLRVSTDKQGRSGLGLEAQRETVQRFLESRESFPPVAEFVEHESGRNNDRPELAKALKACRVRKATLLVAKMDRLARDQQFLMSLIDNKINVMFCDFPQIPDGATGRYMVQQMAGVFELEAGLISERTKAALKAKVARDGQWDRKASHHLIPGAGQEAAAAAVKAKADERAADLLPMIEQWQAEGFTTLAALADKLNAEQIATARGGLWTATAVSRVLKRAAA